jgi:hypothetical protein
MSKEAESFLVFPLTMDVNVISDEEVGSGDGLKESSCMFCTSDVFIIYKSIGFTNGIVAYCSRFIGWSIRTYAL